MAYVVNITSRAERDVAILHADINVEHFAAAPKWYRGLKQAILSLENLLYGRKPHFYRLIYHVRERHQRVDVLRLQSFQRQRPHSRYQLGEKHARLHEDREMSAAL